MSGRSVKEENKIENIKIRDKKKKKKKRSEFLFPVALKFDAGMDNKFQAILFSSGYCLPVINNGVIHEPKKGVSCLFRFYETGYI